MRTTRGTSGGEPSRADRADAAARRLALLAADLGAVDPDSRSGEWRPPGAGDVTRVVPARRAVQPTHLEPAVPIDPAGPSGPSRPSGAPEVPRPGRHAARRRLTWSVPGLSGARLPSLGAPQLAVLAVTVAVGVALAAWWVVRDQAEPVAPLTARSAPSVEPLVAGPEGGEPSDVTSVGSIETVTVDVTGKVRRPGIVVLDVGSRVVDALEAAGGEREGVELASLNLARVLVDGEQIVVGAPPGTVPAVPTAPGGSSPDGAPAALVNLNTATQAELETLPDVGPVTALAIVAWRDEHGGFTSVDELLEVDGIGDVTLAKLAPYVTV